VVGASHHAKARVALFKGLLILSAALIVGGQVAWRLLHPSTPIVDTMGLAAMLNLSANLLCLWLLSPHRKGDVNMASAWECSRNDVAEGIAVIAATIAVWLFHAGWPDLVIAAALLILFLRSAIRVLRSGWHALQTSKARER
jgi:Co/Zn/Cd efflux system component